MQRVTRAMKPFCTELSPEFKVFAAMKNLNLLRSVLAVLILFAGGSALASTYVLPPPGADLIGENQVVYARYEDTLMDIARRHGLGYDEILAANPDVDRWIPGDGTPVVLPTRFILPDVPREGLVLNLPEMRLYYFPKAKNGEIPVVITHPAGIGRMDWQTPLGTTKIINKAEKPTWRPPASIKKEHLEMYGEILPDVVPAGPANPLGEYAMYLGIPGYLIHGTNKRDGVGSRVSHGCVRLYPEDIETLFPQVPMGTKVTIINQPIKIGWLADTLFMEAHAPFEEENIVNEATLEKAIELLAKKVSYAADRIDEQAVKFVIDEASGIVAAISQ